MKSFHVHTVEEKHDFAVEGHPPPSKQVSWNLIIHKVKSVGDLFKNDDALSRKSLDSEGGFSQSQISLQKKYMRGTPTPTPDPKINVEVKSKFAKWVN